MEPPLAPWCIPSFPVKMGEVMKELVINIGKYGSSFASRERARMIGIDLLDALSPDCPELVLDFRGVRAVSYSFTDELLRAVAEAFSKGALKQTEFRQCSNEVEEVLRDVLHKRNRLTSAHLSTSSTEEKIAIVSDVP